MFISRQAPEIRLADWTTGLSRSVLRQMISLVAQPGILSFAGGLPDPALFPRQEFAAAVAQVLATDAQSLQYRPPLDTLKEHIVALMARRGVTCQPEQVFITTGAQQALDILARLLLNPGSDLILEQHIYPGILQAVALAQPRIWPVSTDLAAGIDVEAVEATLRAGVRPAFIYVIPDAHNPLGVSISEARRQRLVALAGTYGVPIVEDDPYGFLQYDPEPDPPLRARDAEWVLYVGSFSKIMAPALRLGWLVAPPSLLPQLTVIKEASDLETSALTQRAVSAYLDAGHLESHLHRLRREYGQRRDAMLAALYRYFPAEAVWTRPRGGMFIWVALPPEVDTARLLEAAVAEEQVAFVPGFAFGVAGQAAANCLRLNFSNATPAQIEDGMARLGRLINTRF